MTRPAPYPPIDGTQPCAGEDPEVFFPKSRTLYWSLPRALAACNDCKFIRPCLAYALTNDVAGIWGGTTHAERRDLRKRHGLEASPVNSPDIEQMHDLIELLDRGGGFLTRDRHPPGH